jgi:hypothetical protein
MATQGDNRNVLSAIETERKVLETRLLFLRQEHQDLDQVIDRLLEAAPMDQLQIQRLKKRKLLMKDRITDLEMSLLPDIIA